MNRRGFFGCLAALPFVGGLFKQSGVEVVSSDMFVTAEFVPRDAYRIVSVTAGETGGLRMQVFHHPLSDEEVSRLYFEQ